LFSKKFFLFGILAALLLAPAFKVSAADTSATILKAPDVMNLVPTTVFFRGQVASVQARNAAGLKLPDGMLVLCALVDTSGYSTAVQQKYQAYLINEAALDINGQILKPGAYGVGFIESNKFVVMDVGAHDLLTAESKHDPELKRPMPLQILTDAAPNHYRLYINRNYVVVSFADGK
jgi:hypothetical protein